jgi:hypothetical protein
VQQRQVPGPAACTHAAKHLGLSDDARSTMPASAGAVRVALLHESSWQGWDGDTLHILAGASLARAHYKKRHLLRTRNYGGPVLHRGIFRWGYLYNYYSACCRHHSEIAYVVYEHLLHSPTVGRFMHLPRHRSQWARFAVPWSFLSACSVLPD